MQLAIHQRVLKSRVFVALHMHAGDGNVHTNIPVNSDDYEMLQQANGAVERIMRLAKDLGGVISGEHGIGITKFDFLEPQEIAEFTAYKKQVDPDGRFNKGKLLTGGNLERAYTPSFNLMELESLILEKSELGRDRRFDQGLPALRQVQAGVQHPCAARQPAVFAAQQDTRHFTADRGVPVRGTDAARRFHRAFRRIQRRRRPLHGLPQVPESLPGGHRFRRRVDRHAQFPAQAGQEEIQSRHGGLDAVPERHRPGHHQGWSRKVMIEWGYKAQRLGHQFAKRFGLMQRADHASARHAGTARRCRRR